MKISLLLSFLLLGSVTFSQNDYKIQINDTTLELTLDKEYTLLINEKKVQFKVFAKDTLVYNDDLFSFNYSKDFKISKMTIEEGIDQIIIMTAEGSGFLIQKYSTMNPTILIELMISEITKESMNYGFKLKREDYTRSIKSGQKLSVDKAILNYKDETNIYEVASFGKKDEGIIIMTMIMDENLAKQGKKIIELMWNSLIIK